MKKWTVGMPDRKTVSSLMLSCGVSSLAAAAIASKGYSSPESVMEALNVSELSDPFLIKDMQKAADTINAAIDNDERICIYGDYDCDGIMATVILYSYLSEAGADVFYYIPERSEGYGLNMKAIDSIAEEGASLIVTVDNGISAISEAEYIYSRGMKLVVTDHHQQGEQLPRAEAVADPHRHDCFSPFKYMCGAGIALKLVAALDGGDYTMALEQFGDLAAIATVADIVSLTGENRFLVSYGMELLSNSDRPSIIALKEVCGLTDKPVDSQVIGFGLAPRINAAGRFGSPKTAAELFLCEDCDEALTAARELDRLNNMRKDAENSIISEIEAMIDKEPKLIRGRVIFLCGKDWHHGVIGIVASRIVEKFGKPCFIASDTEGEIRGSARSFGEFSVFGALTACSDVLEKFGGHPGAGGFTIKSGKADEFGQLLEKYALENHKVMPLAELKADIPLTPAELTVENVQGLSVLEPFGTDNEKPLFYIEKAEITDITPLSDGAHTKLHIKLGFTQADALIFRKSPSETGLAKGDICDMIVNLGINEFRGKTSVSIVVCDIRPHMFEQNKYFAASSAFEAFLRGEELPQNYYPSMYPSRDDVVKIYKAIPNEGICSDTLYIRLNDRNINYCKFCIAAEALRQLGLVTVSCSDKKIKRVKVSQKADLDSAAVLVSLRSKLAKSH
ncbi:single-stranded-DNA-specific exonuclease [Ruminococcus flavefaciens]|uniref:Single-stranded-DNA-specific exonuclease RecJ n=1 Tax=Ruminococcus flavefaciens TaxID=1265 RepID=A0A1H6HY23_RUMFL|nr:single-stranded-DNA-specific exonuclease RecJ [Ruminococcus flavefaciens]SEH39084.1 single-stranded-DNA-specific exonuclease [Ruminococcus flavefaciens]